MKISALSLATVLALSTSAYAVELENIKVSGQATLYYQTLEKEGSDNALFSKEASMANVALGIKFKADLGNNFGFGAKLNVLDTAGLEGELVMKTMQSIESKSGDDNWFFGEAYITKTVGNTLVKIGRQELNTPLAFSEKWNVVPTTYDAAVIVNSDLADNGITLVGAYVSKSNSHGSVITAGNALGTFDRLGKHGAYAVAALYGKENIKANAWYYTVPSVADAFWIDANTNIAGVNLTTQFAGFMLENDPVDNSDANTLAFAGKGSYKVNEQLNVCLAAAQTTGEKSSHTISNVGAGVKTKLATGTILANGKVAGATDTTSFKLNTSYNLGENGKFIATYGHYMHGENSSTRPDDTASILELIYKRKLVGMDLLVAYFHMDNIMLFTKEGETSDLVRVVARYNF